MHSIKHNSLFNRESIKVFLICFLLFTISISHTIADTHIGTDFYDRDTAYIGVMSRLLFSSNRTDTAIATETIFREFLKHLNKESNISFYEDTKQILSEMKQHRLDAILTNTMDYLDIDHQINPDQRYALTFDSRLEQKIYLLTHKSTNITRLEQLQNLRIAVPEGQQLGRLFLDYSLLKENLPVSQAFFKKIVKVNNQDSAIINLFFNQVDAALVTDAAFQLASDLNTQIPRQLKIIHSSQAMVPLVIGVNKSVPSAFLGEIGMMVDHADDYPRIRHLLSIFKADGIVRINDQHIVPVKALREDYHRLLKKHTAPLKE